MYNEDINIAWHRKLSMKVAIIKKNYIIDFSCMIFWAQTVPIPPDQNLLIHFHQNMWIRLVNIMHNGTLRYFGIEN